MEATVKNWTDERLEERFDSIDRRFDFVERRLDSVERRMDAGFQGLRAEMKAGDRELRVEMNAGFARVDAKFDALNRTLLQLGGATIAALLGLIATQL